MGYKIESAVDFALNLLRTGGCTVAARPLFGTICEMIAKRDDIVRADERRKMRPIKQALFLAEQELESARRVIEAIRCSGTHEYPAAVEKALSNHTRAGYYDL